MQSQAWEAPPNCLVSPLALHLFSTATRRRISLISEEPFNWTSVGIIGSKSKWTQIGQRVNELSRRWNKNRPSQLQRDSALSSWGLNLHPHRNAPLKAATFTMSPGQICFFFILFIYSLLLSPPLHWFKFKLGEFKQGLAGLLVVFSGSDGGNRERQCADKQLGNFTRKAIRLLWMLSHWKQLLT